MNKSKLNCSIRCRPALGTLVRVRLSEPNEQAFAFIFDQLAFAESKFSYFSPSSELSRWNRGERENSSAEFVELMQLSLRIRALSANAFSPFVHEQRAEPETGSAIDFGGIAKGYAVDMAVRAIEMAYPSLSGFVEAGGEIRFFGDIDRTATIRLGVPPNVSARELTLTKTSVATSAPDVAAVYAPSKTRFAESRWPLGTAVTVMADSCAVADALTKVALFAPPDVLRVMVKEFGAQFLFFDPNGELLRSELAS